MNERWTKKMVNSKSVSSCEHRLYLIHFDSHRLFSVELFHFLLLTAFYFPYLSQSLSLFIINSCLLFTIGLNIYRLPWFSQLFMQKIITYNVHFFANGKQYTYKYIDWYLYSHNACKSKKMMSSKDWKWKICYRYEQYRTLCYYSIHWGMFTYLFVQIDSWQNKATMS